MAYIVKDKHEKHLIMMEQNGLNRWTYWLVKYTFNYLLYIPIALEIGILSVLFKFRLFTQVHRGVTSAIELAWSGLNVTV